MFELILGIKKSRCFDFKIKKKIHIEILNFFDFM